MYKTICFSLRNQHWSFVRIGFNVCFFKNVRLLEIFLHFRKLAARVNSITDSNMVIADGNAVIFRQTGLEWTGLDRLDWIRKTWTLLSRGCDNNNSIRNIVYVGLSKTLDRALPYGTLIQNEPVRFES